MRRGSLFWAIILIVVGVALLLNQLFAFDVWVFIGPLLLILFGLWVLLGAFRRNQPAETKNLSLPLEQAERARIALKHGAGEITVDAGTEADTLLSGTFVGGIDYRREDNGGTAEVSLRTPPDQFYPAFMPWVGGRGFAWNVRLNTETPMELLVDSGASSLRLNLADLLVTELTLHTGASSADITLPAHAGHSRVTVESGAASIKLRVPPSVTARIRSEGGLSSTHIDTDRFPRSGQEYRSPDYDRADNRVDIVVKSGVGSVDVR